MAKASRVLLFVHGIIGDTQSMVPSVQLGRLAGDRPLARGLATSILTFDYENLNTLSRTTAAYSNRRLEAVGLGARATARCSTSRQHSMGA